MEGQVLKSGSKVATPDTPKPGLYKPSWIDRLMAAVERLPIPYWLTYLMLCIVEVGIFHVVAWIDGWVSPFQFVPITIILPLWLWGPLAIMTYLDAVALNAVRVFSPLLEVDDETVRHLEYEFTAMPSRPVIVNGLVWATTFAVLSYFLVPISTHLDSAGPFSLALGNIIGLFTFFTGTIIHYHTIRQLRLVSQTVAKVPRFSLFHLDPVYAFSVLTAQTGIAWIFLASITVWIYPFGLSSIPVIIISILQIVLALAAFILPLWRIHQRLVNEKMVSLADLNRRTEAAIRLLHQHLDEDDLSTIGGVSDALTGLAAERAVVEKIPTWPWRAGTLTGILSALALPVVVFVVQLALQRWLGL